MKVAILMGSTSDLSIMQQAADALSSFAVEFHMEVVSAHRTPDHMVQFARTASERGFEILIAGAGAAAHLPGMLACLTTLPVIGVPIQIGKLQGLDALLSIMQMPKGIPVATVAIDNGWNAGLLAVRILGSRDPGLRARLIQYEKSLEEKVNKMNLELQKNSKMKANEGISKKIVKRSAKGKSKSNQPKSPKPAGFQTRTNSMAAKRPKV